MVVQIGDLPWLKKKTYKKSPTQQIQVIVVPFLTGFLGPVLVGVSLRRYEFLTSLRSCSVVPMKSFCRPVWRIMLG